MQPSDFILTYNSKNISADVSDYILSITYTDKLSGEADELQVSLEDADLRWTHDWHPELGATLGLQFGYQGETLVNAGAFDLNTIDYSDAATTVNLRGVATGSQAAVRTRKSRAYENVTLAQIAARIAKKHGMTLVGAVEPLVLDRVTQYAENDLQFLFKLAKQYGYAVKITENNKKMVFWKLSALHETPSVGAYNREDLANWSASETINDIPEKVEVRHHDSQTKKLVVYGVKAGETQPVGYTETAGKSTGSDTARMHVRHKNASTAKAHAEAHLAQKNLDRLTLNCAVAGNPKLLAGSAITLNGLGALSGGYFIITATHNISRSGYTTQLELKRHIPPAALEKTEDKKSKKSKKKGKKEPERLDVYGVKDGKTVVVGTVPDEE